MQLANCKIGCGELSNNKYSNIIGVTTSVYKPSAVTDNVMTTQPVSAPTGGERSYDRGRHKHDGRFIYPSYFDYPYPYPYVYAPLQQQTVQEENIEQKTEKKTENKLPVPAASAIEKETTFFQQPIGKLTGLIVLALAVYGGYRVLKSK